MEVDESEMFASHFEAEAAVQKLIDSGAKLGVNSKAANWPPWKIQERAHEGHTCQNLKNQLAQFLCQKSG